MKGICLTLSLAHIPVTTNRDFVHLFTCLVVTGLHEGLGLAPQVTYTHKSTCLHSRIGSWPVPSSAVGQFEQTCLPRSRAGTYEES